MNEMKIITTKGAETILKATAVEDLRACLRGELLCPGEGGYEIARKIHNGLIDRRPAMIVRCAGVADVIASVQFARSHDLLISVRGGGHGVPGFAVCDGGIMIDLSRMQSVRVDPARRTARAEGGTTWGAFDRETQAFGLATTGGTARPTGIAGLTLGGGHGFLMRRYGLACDNLLSVDMVTADGRFLTAGPAENADLFWGVRGGGGNFGVVTSFEYRLHPVGRVLGGVLFYPLEKTVEVLRLYRDVAGAAPDELGSLVVFDTLPDGTHAVGILVGYHGPVAKGERLLRPLRAFSPILADQVGPIPYIALQSFVEKVNPPGLRNYWKSNFLTDLSDDAVRAMVDGFAAAPDPHVHIVVEHMGGAVSRVGKDETAVNDREAPYNAIVIGMWTAPEEDETNIRWVRETWDAMQRFSSGGVYVNYLGEEGETRVRAAYGPEKYERLVRLKTVYDPANLFRCNQNIRPSSVRRAA